MDKKESIKLKALSDIASIDISLEFNDILHQILKITCETMNGHSGTIMLVDEDTNELKMVSSYGLPENYIETVYEAANKAEVQISSSPSGTVLNTGKYFVVSNIYNEPKNRPWHHLAKELGFSAQIFAPMKRGLKVIGLLNIYMPEVYEFSDEEINFVNIAASQASSVVQNARMCRRLKDNIDEINEYKEQLEYNIRKANNRLFESEAKYRDLFENADDPMYTIDNKGFFMSINNAGCRILGASKEEITGTHISIWLTPESLEYAKQRIKKHNSSENVNEPVVYELVCKNGEHRWAEIRTRPLKEGDRITGIHGIGRDITEKIKIEQKLIESEVKYRELFENANDGIYTHDINGFFLTINDAGCKILESTKDEIIGTHISKWLTTESLELAKAVIKKYVSGENVKQPIILELITKNKKHLFLEFRNRLIKDEDRIIAIHGIARDITEKITLENAIKESELKYRDLFENAQDPMFVVDTTGHFLKMNKACLEIIGCSLEELRGSPLSKWITPESYKVYLESRAACFSNKPRKPMEIFELICKNGEQRKVEVKTRAIKIENKSIEIHCIARDITEKTRLEQKIKEYHEKLEKSYSELLESDRIKAEFISNITHELLTPLTSIRGFVELLDDETMGKINPEQKKSLEIILRNSDRLIRLIKELLDASNLENNKLGMQFRLISLNNILSRSMQDTYPQANEKKILFIKDIQQLPEIWGDEERLIQVITNLLTNAIKFTDRNGKITVRATEDKENVRISITDTGIGIPADKLKIIFDKFYQVDGSSSRKYGGVGIGLSICKSIINKHYGSIWAESDGLGSTFHISIPKLKSNTGEKNV